MNKLGNHYNTMSKARKRATRGYVLSTINMYTDGGISYWFAETAEEIKKLAVHNTDSSFIQYFTFYNDSPEDLSDELLHKTVPEREYYQKADGLLSFPISSCEYCNILYPKRVTVCTKCKCITNTVKE